MMADPRSSRWSIRPKPDYDAAVLTRTAGKRELPLGNLAPWVLVAETWAEGG
jgi:hypothetical protein